MGISGRVDPSQQRLYLIKSCADYVRCCGAQLLQHHSRNLPRLVASVNRSFELRYLGLQTLDLTLDLATPRPLTRSS